MLCSVPCYRRSCRRAFFFFHAPATPELYTLSLHDALPICGRRPDLCRRAVVRRARPCGERGARSRREDRKSTRLNSSHANISYAVFCLKKKKDNRSRGDNNRRAQAEPALQNGERSVHIHSQ